MNVQDIPRAGDDLASAALINAATALLTNRRHDIDADFLAGLFCLAVPEDLARYQAQELADIAERSWSFLAERQAGIPKIRFEPVRPGSIDRSGLSILEIVNDDMPFLVDSVIGEINRRGFDIRLF